MDQATQQNASSVEEAAAAAESMQDQAAKLAQAVSVFKLAGTPVAGTPVGGMQTALAAPAARGRSAQPAKPRVNAIAKNASTKGGFAVAAPKPRRSTIAPPVTNDEWEQF
jgi:hypothetical protein